MLLRLLFYQLSQKSLEVLEYLSYGQTTQMGTESFRRFAVVARNKPMPDVVQCSFAMCTFSCNTIESMLRHQAEEKHPGWSKKCPARPNEAEN